MEDTLISRRAAIDAINHICPVDTEYDYILLDRIDVACVLSDLPSVQPKEGKWMRESIKGIPYHCSVCTGRFDYEWKFCPNCGADMRGASK